MEAHRQLSPLARDAMRVALAVILSASVLGGAYLVVRAPGSGSVVIVRQPRAPVKAVITAEINLGRAHAVLAGGAAGLFVAQQPKRGPAGRISQVDTVNARLAHAADLAVLPLGVGVGKDAVWVVGGKRNGDQTTLLRLDPHTLAVSHRLVIAGASACSTSAFASCDPVVVDDGVWVPMLDRLVHISPDGRMADRTLVLGGHVWDVTAAGRNLWALAETALFRIDRATGVYQRIPLRGVLGAGIHSNHVVASQRAVWISSFPTSTAELRISRLTLIDPSGDQTKVVRSFPYPGAGSLALAADGLWVDRFGGQGEVDRLDPVTGSLTGPIVLTEDDVVWMAPVGDQLWVTVYKAASNRRELDRITLTPAP